MPLARSQGKIGRTDGLMGILDVLARLLDVDMAKIILAVVLLDPIMGRCNELIRKTDGIGTPISD